MKAFAVWSLVGFVILSLFIGDGVIAAIGAPAFWFTAVQIYPWRPCTGKCKGKGKIGDPGDRKYWGNCPDCKGSGRQRRFGALRG